MSCYEWERGTIKIPSSQWVAFRKGMLTHWNATEEARFARALRAHDELKANTKGLRGAKRKAALAAGLARHDDAVAELLMDGKGALRRPRRSTLRIVPVSKDGMLSVEDATIALNNATRSVTWNVSENNHACEYARKQPIARELFSRLARIRWTRGAGGTIVGNDEYNRDQDDDGGGSNYVTARYGGAA